MMQVVINRGWHDDQTYAKMMITHSDGHYAKPEWAKPYDTRMIKHNLLCYTCFQTYGDTYNKTIW